MKWEKGDYLLTDDKSLIDLDHVSKRLSETYWATGRTREQVEVTIRNSVFFSLHHGPRQIGFSRLLSDGAAVALLNDVFIDPAYRGRGLGQWMLSCLLTVPEAQVPKVLLVTRDAQGLYEKFGFETLPAMIKRN